MKEFVKNFKLETNRLIIRRFKSEDWVIKKIIIEFSYIIC